MKSTHNAQRTMIALLLVFALLDLSLQTSFAAPALSSTASAQTSGSLSTRGNRAIVVNGNNTEAGATILDGATIETPDGTGATIDLGPLGSIDLAPNTVAVINFSNGEVKVTLKRGCAIVRNKEGVKGSIDTPDGSSTPTDQPDGNNRKRADVCFPVGATTPVVNAGAAANAGAGAAGGGAGAGGASSAGAGAAAGGGGGGGLSTGAIAAIVAGAIVGVIVIVVATGEDDNISGFFNNNNQ